MDNVSLLKVHYYNDSYTNGYSCLPYISYKANGLIAYKNNNEDVVDYSNPFIGYLNDYYTKAVVNTAVDVSNKNKAGTYVCTYS